jgi:gas vesicle protein
MSTKSSLAIALTALAAGAALGVLLAPRSGAETRKKIMRKGDALKDRLNEMLREGEGLLQDLKGEAETAAKERRTEANSVK